MDTAASTVRRETRWACVIYPFGLEQSIFSTELDLIRRSLGRQETSALGLRVAGVESGLSWPLRIAHWLTESSKLGLLLPIVWHPVPYRPVLVIGPRPFLPFSGSSWPLPTPSSMSPAVVRMSSDRNPEAGTAVSAGA